MKIFTRLSPIDAQLKVATNFQPLLRSRSEDFLIVADSDIIKNVATTISNKLLISWQEKALIVFDDALVVTSIIEKPSANNFDISTGNIAFIDIGIFLEITKLFGGFNHTIFSDYIINNNIFVQPLGVQIADIDTTKIDNLLNDIKC